MKDLDTASWNLKGRGRAMAHFLSAPWTVPVLLFIVVLLAYVSSLGNGFVNFDDSIYVYQNSHVQSGLRWENVKWAFTNLDAAFWHPLTWLSLMFDRELFGPGPWGFHLTNLLLHATNAVLLFLLFEMMTRAPWRSAFVALLFGIHPLHVESVAWVSERKDLLSTAFWLLAMQSYAGYTQTLKASESGTMSARAIRYYALAFCFFVLGMMSKPMLVTVPFVLLLMDYWPLSRFQLSCVTAPANWKLVLEKAPFVVAALGFGFLAIHSEAAGGALMTAAQYPFLARVYNALGSYLLYLRQTLWPSGMAAFYPYPTKAPTILIIWAALLLLGMSGLAASQARRRPYLLTGWFWYLGTLLPVIGLIQVGKHSRADRYTYVPLIGIFLVLAWGASDLLKRWSSKSAVLSAATSLVAAVCIPITLNQIGYWKDGESLWRHALAVTTNSAPAHCNYARALESKGLTGQAIEHYKQALRIEPKSFIVHLNLGVLFLAEGELEDASNHLEQAVQIHSGVASAHFNLAKALGQLGHWSEAEAQYRFALAADPRSQLIQTEWGMALVAENKADEASKHFEEALRLVGDPIEEEIQVGMNRALQSKGQEASAYYRAVLRLQPDSPVALNNLAWLLATSPESKVRDGALAVKCALRACELTHYQQPILIGTLAAAYAENHDFQEACKVSERAIKQAEAVGEGLLAERNRKLLGLYKAENSYHEPSD